MGSQEITNNVLRVAAIAITSLGFATNMVLLYVVVAIAGATTIGSQNLANSYISQYYPSTVRSTGLGWALGIGRIGWNRRSDDWWYSY